MEANQREQRKYGNTMKNVIFGANAGEKEGWARKFFYFSTSVDQFCLSV
jgi:hypothetical protein